MGKAKGARKLSNDAALAKASSIRTGARKLNVVAASIRGMAASAALTRLSFEKRRVSQDVKRVLQAAIANAENNHGLDVDRLYVAEAWVGRAFVMKRFQPRARGRSGSIEKPFSNLTVVVRERAAEMNEEKPETKKAPRAKTAAKKPTKKRAVKAASEA